MFYPIMRSQENINVSATKVIIETHVEGKSYYNYYKSIIKITTIRVRYKMGTTSKITVTLMNFQKAGFQ